MLVIAVTGGIASGKSTALKILKRKGYNVIDSDKIVSGIYAQHNAVKKIAKVFGSSNKKEIAKKAFSSRHKMKLLESIIHPIVEKKIERMLAVLKKRNAGIVFIEVPVFFESKPKTKFNAVVVVYCPEELQKERLKKMGFSHNEIIKRIKCQKPIEEKKQKADFVVNNCSSIGSLEKEIDRMIEWLRGMNE